MSSLVTEFIAANCVYAPGALLPFGEFAERFADWAQQHEPHDCGKRAIPKLLPPSFPFGRHSDNKRFIGNLLWKPGPLDGAPVVKRNGRLVRWHA
jgi:hypothetical protein